MSKTTDMLKGKKQQVMYRSFQMPCCNTIIDWIGTRLPMYCPECGTAVLTQLRFDLGRTLCTDEQALLEFRNPR